MRRNVASQPVSAQLNALANGAPVTTGTTTVYVTGDNGTQTVGSVGSGAATHKGQGQWSYVPAQAETNYAHVVFTFVNSLAIIPGIQYYPLSYGSSGQLTGVELAADQAVNVTKVAGTTQTAGNLAAMITTVDDLLDTEIPALTTAVADLPTNAELATALDSRASQTSVDEITAGKNDILARLPAALVGGRMDSNVSNMESNTITASVIASSAVNIIQAGLATATSVDDLPTNAELATALGTSDDAVLAQLALVKAKTNQLTFSQTNELDINIQSINDVGLIGDGSSGNKFRVP